MCNSAEQKPLFVVGSSGVEYALVKHWQATESGASWQSRGVRISDENDLPTDRRDYSFRQLFACDRPADRLGA